MAAAHKEPVAKSVTKVKPHIFAANLNGDRDFRGNPIECLHCRFLRPNAVHRSSEELVADLPANPIADVDKRMTGDRPSD